ncbi:MAG: glycosyltransferase, partial [Phycisphaerae bacterium]
KFDKSVLEESINELASSGENLSISANKNFVLMENPFYLAKNNLGNDGERVDIFYKEDIRFDELGINQKNHCRRYEYAKSIISPGKIVGDFACGTGYGSVMLSEKSARLIGVDIDEEVIKQIKARYKNIQNVEFVHANVLDLKYQSLFDYIVSFETIEHLKEDDIPKLFAVFSRALKPGGTLILSTPYMEQKTPEAINKGFHLTFQINEAKIQQWLSTSSLACEFFKYQNYQEHNVEDHLEKKDFIICGARSYSNDSPKQQMPKESVPTQSFSTDKKSLTSNKAEKHQPKTVSIVIPVFNNVEYTKRCLKALIENTPNSRYEVIIVDNGSTDGTKEFLKCLSGSVKIISNCENLGFAKACNQGAAAADGNYLVFLNSDTKVQPGWLEQLLEVLENDSEVGAVGSKLLYPDGSIQHAGVAILHVEGKNSLLPKHVFMRQPSDHIFVNVPMLFQVVTAACIVIRKSDFESVDGFDESYWNGYEDVDLCFKLTKAGKKIVYQPKSVVLHYESRSSKEERYKRIQQNDRLLQERWAGKIKPDVIICGNQVRQGPSQTIQPYLQNDESVSVSRSEYINALTYWVQKSIVEPIRSPVKKFRFAIKTCTPTRNDLGWGDTNFVKALAKAIIKSGHNCEVHFWDEWGQPDNHIDIVIHIKGLFRYEPKPYNFNILWVINHPELHTLEEISQFDVVFCASKLYFESLKNNVKIPCFYLPQVTDDEVFNPSKNSSTKDIDILFVGNNYYQKAGKCRKIIQDILETGKQYNLCVVGQGWRNFLDDKNIKAEFVEWEKSPELYARAKIVLNDHQETMRQFGFVNNRTFDLAALKAFQISNYVEGIEEFGIVTYRSPEDLQRKLDYFLHNKNEREEFAQISNELCARYTFLNAAREIFSVISGFSNEITSRRMKSHATVFSKIKSADLISSAYASKPKADKSSLELQSHLHPKVSIITSCYNCEKFLPECLDSIRNQTMPQWELFLLDDGSTDSTRRIIEQYCRMDERIKPYYFQDNKGPYLRRNFAIERANSDFIVIQDADDIMCLSKLGVLYREINSDNRLAIVGAFYYIFLDEFRGLTYTDPVELLTEHSDIIDLQSSWQSSITQGSAIIRKTLFDAIGPYDENPFASDLFWLVKAAEYAKYCTDVKFKNIPEYLTFVRVHRNPQTGLLSFWDQRSRRFRYRCYCECKMRKIRPTLAGVSHTDLKNELRNCVCSDFLERFKDHIIRWESVPLANNVIPELLGNSVWLFNKSFYVSCVSMLRGIEQMQPNIETRFRNYDLLRAMAFFALDMKKQSLMYLNREIQNHNNPAAKQFISDYFEGTHFAKEVQNGNPEKAPLLPQGDVQKWCAENSDLYDLQMIDTKTVPQTI